MNKAAGAGIGVVIILIAIAALYMMNQSGDSTMQGELTETVEMTDEESKEYEVELKEGLKVGDKPP